MLCKFCGEEKKLIKAHIIPKNFYIGIKKHRYLCINFDNATYDICQMGGYDSNILCADCDNEILGTFDQEGYRVLFSDLSKYKFFYTHPEYKIYQLENTEFDYSKLRKFFISMLWRASVSKQKEWSGINLGKYEQKALEILKGKKEYNDLFKILIYKNCYEEDINKTLFIAKVKTSKYKKYVIQMAGYRIEIFVNSSRISNQEIQRYEKYFLNPSYAHIIETQEVSRQMNIEYQRKNKILYDKGFKPPKPLEKK